MFCTCRIILFCPLSVVFQGFTLAGPGKIPVPVYTSSLSLIACTVYVYSNYDITYDVYATARHGSRFNKCNRLGTFIQNQPPHSSRPVLAIIQVLRHTPLPLPAIHGGLRLDAMRDAHMSLQKILTHEAPVLKRRTDRARVRLASGMARFVPLALVLPQEAHAAGRVLPSVKGRQEQCTRSYQEVQWNGLCST